LRRRRLLLAALVVVVAGGVAAALVLTLGNSNETRILVQQAVRLKHRVRPTVVRLQPTRRLKTAGAALLRRLTDEGHDEHRSTTRAAAAGATFVSKTTNPPTTAKALKASPGASDVALLDHSWFSGGNMSLTAEPTVAANDDRILGTWNWAAALSSDGGRTFTFADPFNDFPGSHDGFCCDQLAYYVPDSDLWVWLLQYGADETGNILRLAVARGSAAFDAGRRNRTTFKLFDLSPSQFGWPADAEFDFNGISSTKSSLFVSTNVSSRAYEGLILRIPLDSLVRGVLQPSEINYFKTPSGSVPRLARGAGTTMYFAVHKDASTLTVWSWPDGTLNLSRQDVPHDAYNLKKPYRCPRTGGSASGDWCEGLRGGAYKNDDAILSGWVAQGRVGFAWDAGQDGARGLPYPHVMIVEVDANTLRLADETLLWSPKYAYQYPAIVPNTRGDLAGVVLRGGGAANESCTAVIRDRSTRGSGSGWASYTLAASNHAFGSPYTGDYVGAAPLSAGSNAWIASCMTLRGGSNPLKNLRVHWFSFGRSADAPR